MSKMRPAGRVQDFCLCSADIDHVLKMPNKNLLKSTKNYTGAPPAVKGLVWFSDRSRMKGGTGAGVYWQSAGRMLRFSLGRYITVFQAELYAILACVCEIQSQNRPEKYVSICSDTLAALKALRAVRTKSSLVRQCQRALSDISVRHAVGLFWGPRTCWNTGQ